MTDLKSMLPEELETYFVQTLSEPRYRAGQVFSWLNRGVTDFDEMRNLPKSLREKLRADAFISSLRCLQIQRSATDGTQKFLWELQDGNAVETVVMRHTHGVTVCISSQVGCRMGCAFCASTIGGLVRGLTAAEMLDEVLYSQRESGERITNIVLMGIGEPLDNYDAVLHFLHLVNHPDGLNIGMRHISLSTCGLTEGIRALAAENLQLTLAISLHAPDDETRSALMPVNRACGVEKLVRCCEDYFAKTGRRVTFEYAMIGGVNDSTAQAQRLAALARRARAHINLIPLNRVEERTAFSPSTPAQMKAFCAVLEQQGANFTIRRSLGGDVDAACGQLRRKREDERNL